MPSRHRSRQRALQILFSWDLCRQPVELATDHYYATLYSEEYSERPVREEFTDKLVRGVAAEQQEIDARISKHAAHWRIERMPVVDRNILRLAVYEMKWIVTPPPVVINEALELAKQFSAPESVQFINGVLDAIHWELRESGQLPPAPAIRPAIKTPLPDPQTATDTSSQS